MKYSVLLSRGYELTEAVEVDVDSEEQAKDEAIATLNEMSLSVSDLDIVGTQVVDIKEVAGA